jgi:hypothetical protein
MTARPKARPRAPLPLRGPAKEPVAIRLMGNISTSGDYVEGAALVENTAQ